MMTRIIAFVVILLRNAVDINANTVITIPSPLPNTTTITTTEITSVISAANITLSKAVCEDEVPDCEELHVHKDQLCNVTGKFKWYAALACRKTCGYCTDYCVDNATNCKDSTFDETCLKNITWALIKCPVYCGFCGVLGRSCDKTTEHVCKRIPGVSCKSSMCTCNAGFQPVAHIECEEVYWKRCNASNNCSRLENSDCKIPQNPETTYSHWTNSSHCICKSGYAYNYENHSCDVVCPRPVSGSHSTIKNESLKTGNYTYGDIIEYVCETGYEFENTLSSDLTVNSTCKADKTWSVTPNCTIKVCPNPENDNTTVVEPNLPKLKGNYTYEDTVKYKCINGFEFKASDSSDVTRESKCTENGNWSITPPTCTIKVCPSPVNDTTTVVEPKAKKSDNFTYEDIVEYKCITGFEFNTGDSSDLTRESECTKNGNWSITPPTCTIKDCNKPSSTPNGNVVLTDGISTSFNHTAKYTCNHGYQTKNNTSVTCSAFGNWSSPAPTCTDIDECRMLTDDCHKYAACTNTNGSYTCKCRDGFNDTSVEGGRKGINCTDINECDKNPCNSNGSQCINYPGKYFCMCDDGWTGKYCKNDTDECESNTTCGVNANCTNSLGSYSCKCNPGFPQGNPKIHCYEYVIIKLNTSVSCSRGDDQLINAKPIPNRIPYFGKEYSSYRPNMNGFLTLGYQPIYENYGPENAEEWKQVTRGYTVIAPLWTNIDSTNLTGGLCVHLLDYYAQYNQSTSEHRDLKKLGEKFSEHLNLTNFKPRIALVATWKNVTSSSYIPAIKLIKTQNATMQVILISDGIYSYIMFNYDQEQWSLKMDSSIPSSAGYSLEDKTGYITATRHNITNLNKGTNVNPGLNGRWIYNVSSIDDRTNKILKNESECLEFSKNKTIYDWLKNKRSKSDACPCSEIQIQLDYSYHTVTPMYQNKQFKMTCYEEWFFNNDHVKQTCCYRLGALKKKTLVVDSQVLRMTCTTLFSISTNVAMKLQTDIYVTYTTK